MTDHNQEESLNFLKQENELLKKQIKKLQKAIRTGRVSELQLPAGAEGDRVFSLSSEETIYRLIIEEMNEAVFTLDTAGTILFHNKKFSEFLNLPPEGVTGSDIYQYISEHDHELSEALIQQGSEMPASGDLIFLAAGSKHELIFHLDMYPLPARQLGNVCVIAFDITKFRKTEEDLSRAKSELELRINERTEDLRQINNELNSARVAALNMMQDAVEAKSTVEKLNTNLVTEITERKQFERALGQSEERFRGLFEDNIVIMFMIDVTSGRLLDANKAAVAYYGWSHEEMLQKSIYDLNARPVEEVKQALQKAAASSQVHFEFKHRRADGSVRDVEVFSSRLRIRDEYFLHSLVFDITERKHIQRINALQHNIAVAVASSDTVTELLDVILEESMKLLQTKNLFFASYNEETGMLRDIYGQDQMDTIEEWSAEKSLTGYLLTNGEPLLLTKKEILGLVESETIHLVGTLPEMWVGVPMISGRNMKGAVVVQSYDNPEAFNRATIEILEVIAHELLIYMEKKQAQELAYKLTKAIEQSPVSVIITDRAGRIEYVNNCFCQTTGYSYEEVMGEFPRILQSGETPKEVYQELWATILKGGEWHGEFHNKKKSGELFWENAVISPVVNSRNEITNFFAIKEDITEQKLMLEELISAKDKAEQMSRLKSSFLANMSHELRTPLIAILGFSEILTDEAIDENSKELSQLIHKGGIRLLETLNLILNLSAIEANKVDVKNEIVDSHVVLNDVIELFGAMASKKELTLVKKLKAQYSMLLTDRQMFTQIFNNLLNNAIKFTHQGSVTVKTKNSGSKLSVSVIDSGIGISEADQQIIWEEFRQASEGYNRSFEGTGLGLTITRTFVKKLGGQISLQSEPNKGTTVMLQMELEFKLNYFWRFKENSYANKQALFTRAENPDHQGITQKPDPYQHPG